LAAAQERETAELNAFYGAAILPKYRKLSSELMAMRAQEKVLRTAGQPQKAKQMKQSADASEDVEMDAVRMK
jgi:hypothetical protein